VPGDQPLNVPASASSPVVGHQPSYGDGSSDEIVSPRQEPLHIPHETDPPTRSVPTPVTTAPQPDLFGKFFDDDDNDDQASIKSLDSLPEA
jgi:hypothetical protein